MYLIDTDVVSELRKGAKANVGVVRFISEADRSDQPLYILISRHHP